MFSHETVFQLKNLAFSLLNLNFRFFQFFNLYLILFCKLQIREAPHSSHHKFIEFYDVRAAEAALHALNSSDIAGKRIKLEPSRVGVARW